MRKILLFCGVLVIVFVVIVRIGGDYIFNRPGGLSGKPKEIAAQPAFLPIINQCNNVHPDRLNMNVLHAALLGYCDPEWLMALSIPAANMDELKSALTACYQQENIRKQKLTIRLNEPLDPLPEQSRASWWAAQNLDTHMQVQLVFAPEQSLVYARMFSW